MKMWPFLATVFAVLIWPNFAYSQIQQVEVNTTPIASFDVKNPAKTRFGKFDFVGGLVLRSHNEHLGAISGMRMGLGNELTAVSDTGFWFQATVKRNPSGVPTGFTKAEIAPVLDEMGKPFERKWRSDIEGLTFADDWVFASAEMDMRVMAFRPGGDLFTTPSIRLTAPFDEERYKISFSLEAIASLPTDHPLYPGLIVFHEGDHTGGTKAPAFILKDGKQLPLAVQQHDGYFITDADFLPSGDLLLLERRYSLVRGAGMRLRQIKADTVKPGALLQGDAILEAGEGQVIDNMEALSVFSGPNGSTRIALMSDDNHWLMQRTLYLEFQFKQ